MASAIATDASLALAILMHFNKVSTGCTSPASKKTCDPPMEAACSETVTSVERDNCPASMASNIRSMVITFVTLAIGRGVSAAFSYKTPPVVASIKMALGQLRKITSVSVSQVSSAKVGRGGMEKKKVKDIHRENKNAKKERFWLFIKAPQK